MEDVSWAIKTAIKMENDGIKFYREAADKLSHPLGKKMFLSLSTDEERHLSVLKELLFDLKFSKFEKYFGKLPTEKIKTVFDEMKDQLKDRIATNSDEKEVLKVGMQAEDKSVNFYQNFLQKVTDKNMKALFERLVEEEREHYKILQNTYSFLEDSGEWFLWEEKGILDGGELG
ncbi:ferritin family protein [Candidatus Aerophobetes bacterium]|nr:ferritin family protein [Candidatus Aerophobetes bacterium]